MERRALQIAIALAACVPVAGGLKGAWLGARAFGAWPGAAADSHVRYLSGLLLAIGLIYWGCIPAVERRGTLIRALTAIVVIGGLARLAGWIFLAGDPGSMRWALVMELGVAPLLCLWQARVAKRLDGREPTPPSSRKDGEAGLSGTQGPLPRVVGFAPSRRGRR